MLVHKYVCLLVDLADLCTVSHANFVLDMIWCNIYFVDTDTALFRLPELVDWNILLWEKRAVHRIKLRWKAASSKKLHHLMLELAGAMNLISARQMSDSSGTSRYLSVSVSRTPSDWNKTFIWPHFYPAETLEPGHLAHQANGAINSVVTRRSSQCTKCSKISVESCLMDWGIIWCRGFLWILNQIKFLRGQH